VKNRISKRVVIGLVVAMVVIVAALMALPRIWIHRLRPAARDKVIELLEERFDDVRLERLDLRLPPGSLLFPRLMATGEGFSISLPGRATEGVPPFVTMKEFEVEVGLFGILRNPIRVRSLRMDELTIQIPPKKDEGPGGKSEPPPPFVVEYLVADGAVLRILPQNPKKDPLQFDLHQLRVRSAGLGEPMEFDAILRNAKPPGEIQTEGKFGPLRLFDAGASPVSGRYVFAKADLSVFDGIGGTLYSEGQFDGVLGRIEVSGFTETPDFQLKSAGNPTPLRTDFEAVVDGTSGDTFLQPVEAVLARSRFRTEGGVAKRPGTDGKTVCLDAEGRGDRIEDFLRLAMKTESPFMTGEVRFRSLILIPPGKVDVVGKLVLDGEFVIETAQFTEGKVQERVDKLSQTGQGETAERAVSALREERVASDMRGSFRLEGGVMSLSYLSFAVPGAEVRLKGTYGLVSERIDFRGELRTEAKVSEMTSGVKSFFLKLLDPLFEKKGAGAVIPIRIGGTADSPAFGLDMGRVVSGDEVTSAASSSGGTRDWQKEIPSCDAILGNEETPGG
jgi:hypothetical protein